MADTPTASQIRIQALSGFSTCEIGDAMIQLEYSHGGHVPDLTMYSPARLAPKVRICGEAYCVQMVQGSDTEAPKPSHHYVDAAQPNSVIVIACPPGIKSATWGGLMTARAKHLGAKGVIIDGRCRDLAEHHDAGFPVFARSHSILGQRPFLRPSTLDKPVTIFPEGETSFPPITIYPRDVVVADMDGVVVVPAHETERVLRLCAEGREVDAKCMDDLRLGKSIKEAFAAHRGK